MTAPTIVTARAFPPELVAAMETMARVRSYDPVDPDQSLKDARIWLGTAVDPVPAELIARFPDSLGLIANLGVGTDNVDLAAAAKAGLLVSNTPVVTEDTADLTLALLLATCRRLGECERALRGSDWPAGASLLGRRIHGATLLPHIGSATAECRADMAKRALASIQCFILNGSVLDPRTA